MLLIDWTINYAHPQTGGTSDTPGVGMCRQRLQMPLYIFKLDDPSVPGVMEEFPDDVSAKRHACTVVDEINRSAGRRRNRVLVLDGMGTSWPR